MYKRQVYSRNVVFIDTAPHLLSPSIRPLPPQGLEASSFDYSNKSLNDKDTSREDMMRDLEDYASALDADANST